MGGIQDFRITRRPLGTNWVFELGWPGFGLGFWDKGKWDSACSNPNWQQGMLCFCHNLMDGRIIKVG